MRQTNRKVGLIVLAAAILIGATGAVIFAADLPTIYVSTDTVNEADGRLTFTLSLSASTDENVKFDYTTVDGTATVGSDYRGKWGGLTIAAGDTEATIDVDIYDDALDEDTESFYWGALTEEDLGLSSTPARYLPEIDPEEVRPRHARCHVSIHRHHRR